MGILDWLHWLTGGAQGDPRLVHGRDSDAAWVVATAVLSVAVALGSLAIAASWRRSERALKPGPARTALARLRGALAWCGLCGYLILPVVLFWPAWRLSILLLLAAGVVLWRTALSWRELTVVYGQLARTERLARDIEKSREESRRKSFFLNAMSHDLKTPLNGLMLQAELAELHLAAGDPRLAGEALHEIKSCARATADLLNSFMEVGRFDWTDSTVEPSPVDLGALVHAIANRHRARAEQKGLALQCHGPARLIVSSDRVKVERILSNLVDNAIKFTRSGAVELALDSRPGEVVIRVSDTGVGIAAENQAAIFEDFYQVQNAERDSRKGFGLGLAIASRLAHQLGGELSVTSTPGQGSRFTLRLPGNGVVTESRKAATVPGPPLGGAGGPTRTGKAAAARG
jgi:signal transduction histidine kinase